MRRPPLTNYWENLDAILTEYRLNYLNARKREDFIEASQILYDRNCAHPPEAFLEDMPKFQVKSVALSSMIDLNLRARRYCDYWNPRLERAMSELRKKNQADYARI